jgi:hypothetical protein
LAWIHVRTWARTAAASTDSSPWVTGSESIVCSVADDLTARRTHPAPEVFSLMDGTIGPGVGRGHLKE